MMSRLGLIPLLLALAGCGDFPRDPHGTLDRIRAERQFRVGLVAPLGEEALDPRAAALLGRVGTAAGAAPRFARGDMETMLDRLETGEVELVLGRFDAKSPWSKMVSFSPPLAREKQGKTEFMLAAAMRNGENGWIALVEKAARDVAPEAQ